MKVLGECILLTLLCVFVRAETKGLTLIQVLKLAEDDGTTTGEIDLPRIIDDLTSTLDDKSELYDDLDLGEIDPSELVKDCSHGRCEFCTKGRWFRACVIAEILSQEIGFRVALVINGHTLFEKKVSVANPPPFCINHIPGLKMLADLCLEIYDVNLKEKSACARVSFKVKILHKKINLKIGCFKLPFKEDEEGKITGEIDNPRLLEDLISTLDDMSVPYDDLDLGEIDPSELVKDCSHGRCEFCTKGKWFKACVIAEVLSQEVGFRVALEINGRTVFEKKVSVANPPPFCINQIPGLKMLADLCLEIYDVNLKEKSACARVSFKVKILHKKINLKIGCFKLPFKEDEEEISDVAGTGTALLAGDLDLSPSELKLTEDDLEELFKDCSKGKCKFCVKKAGFEACMVAEVLSSKIGFVITLTVQGKQILKQEITVPDPKPICIRKTPIKQLTDVCLTFEKINLKELSACAKISAKIKIGPLKPKKFEYEQCFKIPSKDEGVRLLDAGAVQASVFDFIVKDIFDQLAKDFDQPSNDLDIQLKDCSKGTCKFCVDKPFKACLQVDVLSGKIGFDIILTFEGKQVMKQEITIPNPKPFCMATTPIPQVTDLCLALEKINLKELSGCAKVSFKAKIGPIPAKKFEYSQCFKIPTSLETDRIMAEVMRAATEMHMLETEAETNNVAGTDADVLRFVSNKRL